MPEMGLCSNPGKGAKVNEQQENQTVETAEGTSVKETDWRAEAEKWKNFSRTWEQRAKDNDDAKKRLDEIEAERLSEVERANKQLEETRQELEAIKAEKEQAVRLSLRADIANEFGVSKEDRDLYLTADDEDTLRKQAQGLADRKRPENRNQGKGGTGNDRQSAQSWAESLLGKK